VCVAAVDKKLHTTAEENRKLDAELLAMKREAAALGDAAKRAQQELADGRERLRGTQYEAQRRCQQAEGEGAALAEQLAALREHAQGAGVVAACASHRLCAATSCLAPVPSPVAGPPLDPGLRGLHVCVWQAGCSAWRPQRSPGQASPLPPSLP
jgi:hypothetical protein